MSDGARGAVLKARTILPHPSGEATCSRWREICRSGGTARGCSPRSCEASRTNSVRNDMVSLASQGISDSINGFLCLSCRCLPCPRTSVHDVPGLYTRKRERELTSAGWEEGTGRCILFTRCALLVNSCDALHSPPAADRSLSRLRERAGVRANFCSINNHLHTGSAKLHH